MRKHLAVSAMVALACCSSLCAAPFIPERDDQVLERLPLSGDPAARELRRLRQQWHGAPENLPLAVQLATRYLRLARAESDPRYLGYAQAALRRWWAMEAPPPDVLLLRATLRQNRHEFDAALADLAQVLKEQPRNAQAWLTAAVIHQVRGDYAAAMKHCLPLINLADSLAAIACVSGVASLNGRAEQSYDTLLRALKDAPETSDNQEERLWALTLLGEIAARTGQVRGAERHFEAALALGPNDAYLLGAYADFLLDQDQAEKARNMLLDHTRVDGLLLRLALAEQRLAAPRLAERVESLRARFAASRMRGDSLHQGEEARFTLRLLGQPEVALQLARSNWAVQREPRDARILLEAALTAGDREAARPVLEFLAQSRLQDVRLEDLARRIREKGL
jgi:tetratricopeptide (TPR) repeat protein